MFQNQLDNVEYNPFYQKDAFSDENEFHRWCDLERERINALMSSIKTDNPGTVNSIPSYFPFVLPSCTYLIHAPGEYLVAQL